MKRDQQKKVKFISQMPKKLQLFKLKKRSLSTLAETSLILLDLLKNKSTNN